MTFNWLKRYMPRGLYGRAALILILPVVTLQLVVSVIFIQRHFDGVSRQMSKEVARQVEVVLERLPDTTLADDLRITLTPVSPDQVPSEDIRRWYDLAGIDVIETLRENLSGVLAVRLRADQDVVIYIETVDGPISLLLDRRRASAANPHQLLVHMVVFGILMTVIAFLYLRNQLRPITRLAQAAEAFGRGRNVPYSPAGAVEVRAAGSAFLDMRLRLERQIEQRTLMLSGVSHDMRTPLTRLRLGLSMLEDEERAPLERDVDDLQKLLDAFLAFARDDAQSDPSEQVDPIAFITDVVEDARRGGADVTLMPPEGAGDVSLRPTAFRRAVDNLIGNAVRYGTRAEVWVAVTDKSLRVRVDDDGPGIAPDQRERALRPFVRLDPARNQDKGPGVGLGLAIAADIARIHGGVLRLGESDRLGGLRADIVIAR